MRVDSRGHHHDRERLERHALAFPGPRPMPFGPCHVCGEFVLGKLSAEGDAFVADSACPLPQGPCAFETFLDVPSGILVLGNDLRPAFPDAELEARDCNINHFAGLRRLCETTAEHGMLYTFVGNTCPSVYLDGGSVLVGREWDGKPLPGERLGSIPTDLWAVCAADLDRFSRRLAALDLGAVDAPLPLELGSCVGWTHLVPCANLAVRVAPGRYRATHLYHTLKDPFALGTAVFARIDPVGSVGA